MTEVQIIVKQGALPGLTGETVWTIRKLVAQRVIPFFVPSGSKHRHFRLSDVKASLAKWNAEQERIRSERENPTQKTCTKCGEVKPADRKHFQRVSRSKSADGWGQWCRQCRNAAKVDWRRRRAAAEGKIFRPGPEYREFVADRKRRADERAERREAQRAKGREAQQASERLARESMLARGVWICRGCGEKPIRAFYKSSIGMGGTVCIDCQSERDRERARNDVDGLTNSYMRKLLSKYTALRAGDIPQELINAKRVQLRIRRTIKKKEKAI
jgi:hypothetical protein